MNRNKSEYIYRKGGVTKTVGRIEEIAAALGVLPGTIRFYRTPAYKKRASRYKAKHVIDVLRADECECELCEQDAVCFGMDETGEDVPMCGACYENECGWGNTG